MTFLEIETLRAELSSIIPRLSGIPRLLLLQSYYSKLLESNLDNLINSFSTEFIDEYLNSLDSFTPFYSVPEKSEILIDQLERLTQIEILSPYKERIDLKKKSIEEKLGVFKLLLDGKTENKIEKGKLFFPLIGKIFTSNETICYSSVENVKIKISYAKEKDTFLFVPSYQKNEQLEEQARISFQLALNYLNGHTHKFHKHHEVLIYFENYFAEYDGKSLGIALTIGFIEQFSSIYNLPYVTHIKNKVASTGGMDSIGIIKQVGKESIIAKVEAVFYSDLETFVIPKADEIDAQQKLRELKEKYPNRILKLIGVESLDDLLSRRNLVEIKKQSPIVRTGKGIKRNWLASLLILLLTLIMIFIYIRDFDDNPAKIEVTNDGFSLCNKNDKVLWSINNPLALQNYMVTRSLNSHEMKIRIIDTDNDGKNEVMYCFDSNSKWSDKEHSIGLAILDDIGRIKSRISFKRYISSKRENIEPPFGLQLYDTLTYKKKRSILVAANNANSYASALFILSLSENKIISDTLWNSGHFIDARVTDLNRDGRKEVSVLAINNGEKKAEFFNFDLDELKGQVPTIEEYNLLGFDKANMNFCYLIPNTDYGIYLNEGSSGLRYRGLLIEDEFQLIRFITLAGGLIHGKHLIYSYFNQPKDFTIAIGNDFKYTRDSLVSVGKLREPFSDTKEYRELLRKQILAWDGEKFIPLDEWRNKRATKEYLPLL